MKKRNLSMLLSAALIGTMLFTSSTVVFAEEDPVPVSELEVPTAEGDWMIGFSNYSIGNSWRQQMEAEFTEAAEAMKEAGVIGDYVMLNADNDQSKQIADINDLVMKAVSGSIDTARKREAAAKPKAEEDGSAAVQ